MIALLSWRVWAGVALAIFLARTHYKAFHAGGASARADLQAYQLEATQAAAKASEDARKKEASYRSTNERISRDLAKEKANRAADAALLAGRMRDLESALSSVSAQDSTAEPGIDGDPRPSIIAGCASQLIVLDQAVKRLAGQTRGLQAYADDVCVTK